MVDEKPLSGEKFEGVCELLWGPSWKGEAARALKVADRTIYRWAGDEFSIPAGIRAELAAICRKRSAELIKAAERLEK